jgi:hypothetical protein
MSGAGGGRSGGGGGTDGDRSFSGLASKSTTTAASAAAGLAISAASVLLGAVATWRIVLWRARTRLQNTVKRVQGLLPIEGPLVRNSTFARWATLACARKGFTVCRIASVPRAERLTLDCFCLLFRCRALDRPRQPERDGGGDR